MDTLASLIHGFGVVLQPTNLFYCFTGVFMGTLIGVLPGIGPTATIALLLPATFKINPVSAIIMLSGICYGAMYGGSTTSILLNIPGEASSVVTCLDGYQMARKGRAGAALGISAFGSFIAGTFSIIGLMVMAPTLANLALKFGPPENFTLMLMGMMVVTYLARKSMLKALVMTGVGIFIGCIGLDPMTSGPRFTFGLSDLYDGVGLAPVIMDCSESRRSLKTWGWSSRRRSSGERFRGSFLTGRIGKDRPSPSPGAPCSDSSWGFFPAWGILFPSLLAMSSRRNCPAIPKNSEQE